ncbi:hypothetical protein pb186bvf_012459 [Paramecium bursaria]
MIFTPIKVGDMELKNRFVVAPMTRQRCTKEGVPLDIVAEYYSQRASAGLIITESAFVSQIGQAFEYSSAIINEEQINAWSLVTDKVHKNNGKIFIQIYHGGRAVNIPNSQPIAPSDVQIRGVQEFGEYKVPKVMTLIEINEVTQQFRQAAINAEKAGFDGVELQAGNGFLVDQFLCSQTNKRTDEYGGAVENRIRFCLEIVDTLISVLGSHRVGIKVSPISRFNDMYDEDPIKLFSTLLIELSQRKISFVEISNNNDPETQYLPSSRSQSQNIYKDLRSFFKGPIIANMGLTPETGENGIQQGDYDLVSFGTLYISNPNLVEKALKKLPYIQPNPDYFYQGGEKGYIDY